ncbi:MAG: helix-turn-helix transcriptional regulator, partial [Burkholderiales bacterium]|nr:helix-turn-helix transcriptional regulator [Burkholderiales bacterium]
MVRARNEAVIDAFAKTLKEARKQRGMTQEDLADQASLDRTFIGMLETGKRQPTLSVICALAYALHETPSQLLSKAVKVAEMTVPNQQLVHELTAGDRRSKKSASD